MQREWSPGPESGSGGEALGVSFCCSLPCATSVEPGTDTGRGEPWARGERVSAQPTSIPAL